MSEGQWLACGIIVLYGVQLTASIHIAATAKPTVWTLALVLPHALFLLSIARALW